MDGIYRVAMATPLGTQSGTVSFMEQSGALGGTISFQGGVNNFSGGTVNGNTFAFGGTLKTGFGIFQYRIRGKVEGDTLTATAYTRFGGMPVKGKRISA